MMVSKLKLLLFISLLTLSAQALATVGIQCQIIGSSPAPGVDDETLTWDFANGFIPGEVVYGNKGARAMEGALVSGYWESAKRLWLDINITENGKLGGAQGKSI